MNKLRTGTLCFKWGVSHGVSFMLCCSKVVFFSKLILPPTCRQRGQHDPCRFVCYFLLICLLELSYNLAWFLRYLRWLPVLVLVLVLSLPLLLRIVKCRSKIHLFNGVRYYVCSYIPKFPIFFGDLILENLILSGQYFVWTNALHAAR